MTKFAILRKDSNYNENNQWNIEYFGGDKGIFPIKDENGEINRYDNSQNIYEYCLEELAKKGYIPQCQAKTTFYRDESNELDWNKDIFFTKKGFLARLLGL